MLFLRARLEGSGIVIAKQGNRTVLLPMPGEIGGRDGPIIHLPHCADAPGRLIDIFTFWNFCERGFCCEAQRSVGAVPRKGRQGGRLAVHGFSRPVAALHHSGQQAGRRRVRRRAGLRRLQHPRLAGDQRERHARGAAAGNGLYRSVHHAAHAGDDLQHPGPDHARGLLPRPAQRGPQGRQLFEEHRHRRHVLHRPGGRVLHLRRRAVRLSAARRLLPPRQRRRGMEPRPRREAEPGLQASLQGRLLPGAAGRRS